MFVVHDANFTISYRPRQEELSPGGVSREYTAGSVTGAALFDVEAASVIVEASQDEFVSTSFSYAAANVSGALFVPVPSSVAAATWRVRSTSGGKVGLLYMGVGNEVLNPTYPFEFESSVSATDKETLWGVGFSKIRNTRRAGEWNFETVKEVDVQKWRAIYAGTGGFRKPFVLVNPLNNEPYLVRAPGQFPLSLTQYGCYAGKLNASEVPLAA